MGITTGVFKGLTPCELWDEEHSWRSPLQFQQLPHCSSTKCSRTGCSHSHPLCPRLWPCPRVTARALAQPRCCLTCDNVLGVPREGTVPHPAPGRLSRVVALNAQLCHQREVRSPPDLARLICRTGGQEPARRRHMGTISSVTVPLRASCYHRPGPGPVRAWRPAPTAIRSPYTCTDLGDSS